MFAVLVTTLSVTKLDVFVELWEFGLWELGDGVIGVVMGLLISEPKPSSSFSQALVEFSQNQAFSGLGDDFLRLALLGVKSESLYHRRRSLLLVYLVH